MKTNLRNHKCNIIKTYEHGRIQKIIMFISNKHYHFFSFINLNCIWTYSVVNKERRKNARGLSPQRIILLKKKPLKNLIIFENCFSIVLNCC